MRPVDSRCAERALNMITKLLGGRSDVDVTFVRHPVGRGTELEVNFAGAGESTSFFFDLFLLSEMSERDLGLLMGSTLNQAKSRLKDHAAIERARRGRAAALEERAREAEERARNLEALKARLAEDRRQAELARLERHFDDLEDGMVGSW